MHIGPLGLPEIIIILVVVLLIFGPKNLPKLGKAVGRTVKNLREGMDSGKKDEDSEDADSGQAAVTDVVEAESAQAAPAAAPAAATSASATSPVADAVADTAADVKADADSASPVQDHVGEETS